MFRSFAIFTFLLLSVALSFAHPTIPFEGCRPAPQLTVVQAGTAVSLQLNENVSSADVEVGNIVEFLVRSNVTVNGKVVIAAGSIAEGWVKDLEKPCNRCKKKSDFCSKLVITVENVQAVDGQRVNLRSIPHTVRGKCCCKEGPATAKIGTVVSARVVNNTRINA